MVDAMMIASMIRAIETECGSRCLLKDKPEHVPEEREVDRQTLLPVQLHACTHT